MSVLRGWLIICLQQAGSRVVIAQLLDGGEKNEELEAERLSCGLQRRALLCGQWVMHLPKVQVRVRALARAARLELARKRQRCCY